MEQFRICKDCDFSGVYAIVNTTNSKIYIGSSRNIKRRLENHKSKLIHKKNQVKAMQEDYDKGNKFIAYVITPVRIRNERYAKDNDLRYFEHMAIVKFNSVNPEIGYNIKADTGTKQLMEERAIEWAQNEFDIFSNPLHYNFLREPEKKKKRQT